MLRRVWRSYLAAVVMLIIYPMFFIAFVWVTAKLFLTGRTFALDITYKTMSELMNALELDLSDYVKTGKLGNRTKID